MNRIGSSLRVPLASFLFAVGLAWFVGPPSSALGRRPLDPSCAFIDLPVCVWQIKVKPAADGSVAPGSSTTAALPPALQAEVNAIWAPCCISFTFGAVQPVEFDAELFQDGKLLVAGTDGQDIRPRKELKQVFDKNRSKCLNLYFAGDATATGLIAGAELKGIAAKPGNGMLVDDGVTSSVVAHEAGHNFGLPHNGQPGNLMGEAAELGQPGGGTTLDKNRQCNLSYNRARKFQAMFNR